MSNDDKQAEMIGWIILLTTMPFTMAWKGYALSVLWGWFAVPLFDLPSLGIWSASGVALIGMMFTGGVSRASYKKDDTVLALVLTGWLLPAFMLGIGAIFEALAF